MTETSKAPAQKMHFDYFAGEQRTPEWYKLRIGKVTASRLEDWLSVSKAKGKEGTPLQKRLDYEMELRYERQFGVAYDNFVSDAMNDGVMFEDFARMQYEKINKVTAVPLGAWYNEHFVASPDSGVGDEGLLEIKVVRDNTFSEVLSADNKKTHPMTDTNGQTVLDDKKKPIGSGVIEKHWKQIQGQLWASGREWCDYVVINLKTKKVKIIRVLPDREFHEWLELAVPEPISVKPFSEQGLYNFIDEAPKDESKDESTLGF